MNKGIYIILFLWVLCFSACSRKTAPTTTVIAPKPLVEVEPIKKDTVIYKPYIESYKYNRPIYQKPFDEDYKKAFAEMKEMLEQPEKLSFKRAVFLTENAYLKQSLDYTTFCNRISALAKIAKQISIENKLVYDLEDKSKVEIYAGTFNLITEGFRYFKSTEDTSVYQYPPYVYDFTDFDGKENWTQMFVTKLLQTHSGNCHSLPFLYKILVEENGEKSNLALAPNHIYIKHQIKKDGWYNTELTSGIFPVDAWLMASGYIKLEAIQNGVYMKALNQNESIAICLTDLAQGYQKRFGTRSGEYILQCCDLALLYFPNYINALLLKAETQKEIIDNQMKKENVNYVSDLFGNPTTKAMFDDMTANYSTIHKLGYRKMPDKMYAEWLLSLKTEREKYQNKNLNFTNQK